MLAPGPRRCQLVTPLGLSLAPSTTAASPPQPCCHHLTAATSLPQHDLGPTLFTWLSFTDAERSSVTARYSSLRPWYSASQAASCCAMAAISPCCCCDSCSCSANREADAARRSSVIARALQAVQWGVDVPVKLR
jgi:hypothetical protein